MLSVKFQGPVLVEAKDLAALLSLAGVPAVVEPVTEGKKPGRKPNGTNGHATSEPVNPAPAQAESAPAEPAPAPAADAPQGKKRGRKSNAEKAAEAAAQTGNAGDPAPEPEHVPDQTVAAKSQATSSTGQTVATGANFDSLRDRFAGLIDKDYDGALGLLQKFGVDRFGALAEKDFSSFAAELDGLGV